MWLLQWMLDFIYLFLAFDLQSESKVHVHWKGAAELILASCTSWLDADGLPQELTLDKVCLSS